MKCSEGEITDPPNVDGAVDWAVKLNSGTLLCQQVIAGTLIRPRRIQFFTTSSMIGQKLISPFCPHATARLHPSPHPHSFNANLNPNLFSAYFLFQHQSFAFNFSNSFFIPAFSLLSALVISLAICVLFIIFTDFSLVSDLLHRSNSPC